MRKTMAILVAALMLIASLASFSTFAIATPWEDSNVKIHVYDTLDEKDGAVTESDIASTSYDLNGTGGEDVSVLLEKVSLEFKDGMLYVNKLLSGYYEVIFNFGATYGELSKTQALGFYICNNTEQTLDLQPRWVGEDLKATVPGNATFYLADLEGNVTQNTAGPYSSCFIPGGFEGFFFIEVKTLKNDGDKSVSDCTVSQLALRIGGMNLEEGAGQIIFDNYFGMGADVTEKDSQLILEAESMSNIDPVETPEPGTTVTPWENENVKIDVVESFDFPDREIDITEMQVPDTECPYLARYENGKVVIYQSDVDHCSYFRFDVANKDSSVFRHADGIGFYINNDTAENVMLGFKMLGSNLYVIDNDMPIKLFNMDGDQVVATVSNDCLYVPARFEGYVTIAVEYLKGYWNEGTFVPEWTRGESYISSIGFQTYYLWIDTEAGDTVTFDEFFVYGTKVKDDPQDINVAKINGDLIEMPLNEGDAPSSSAGTSDSTSKATGSVSKAPSSAADKDSSSPSWIIWVVIGVVAAAVIIVIIAVAAKKKKTDGDQAPKNDNDDQPKAE
ncbi:MAG: hypothetical protein HPZ00_07200 [Christensenellaceae bacterium]|nr:hypothetical protein [Christensenellaceae bacterium]